MIIWVKYNFGAVKVDASDCDDVYDVIRKVKPQYNELDHVAVGNISLWTSAFGDDGSLEAKEELRPGLPCADLFGREDFKENTDEHPLLVKLLPSVAALAGSSSTVSCKSQSSSGRCATGRHVDRNSNDQKKFRRKILERDGRCIATGGKYELTAAHICPLNKSQLFERQYYFSPVNGICLRKDLEDEYGRHMWYFDECGNVKVLFARWKNGFITKVNLATGPVAPSAELIRLHNKWAVEEAEHHCPYCWKYVGKVNIEDHQRSSCEEINPFPDAQ
jgi:hypothetical protein